MATRSTIAKVQEDGRTVRSIYCHWGGYPEYVGMVLQKHYTDINKIDELLALGDLSALGNKIGNKQLVSTEPNYTHEKEYCFAYGRDRGETGIDALVHANENEWLGFRKGNWCEYGYLWDGKSWHTFRID